MAWLGYLSFLLRISLFLLLVCFAGAATVFLNSQQKYFSLEEKYPKLQCLIERNTVL